MEDDVRARDQTYALWLLLGLPGVGLSQCCFSRRPIAAPTAAGSRGRAATPQASGRRLSENSPPKVEAA